MRITVYLKPGSRRGDMVVENADGSLTIFTKEPAVDGRANAAAIRLAAAHMGGRKNARSITARTDGAAESI